MDSLLFDFEKEKLPAPVVLATMGLIALFALGIPLRVLVTLL
ncbi:hypothetical protein [Halopiger xanaduensis]|uniref:Uncharacterized protein n=1 Tax=Halopiger xanaduensis (strain DSM 18323 / JCM 14033 / SH-6) TaxID=797210 RepID=F8D6C4_HALXS|nr:hypothetical protein [Halopiger xanaduensis]AEH35372.1 hypothetical protein Halxa_0733 [Halopiger xanaduensis SH-6]